jgi:2-polyprenyl-3-methyl-5-hydroxy-6-metoxy-1,4-benzoquinol methylase
MTAIFSNNKIGIFSTSKRRFKSAFKKVVAAYDSYEIGEAALPPYSHKNPLIDWLFWARIKIAYKYANLNGRVKNKILDFGCGSGVLSYMLAKNNHEITGCDIEFTPLNLLKNTIRFPLNIDFVEGDILDKKLINNSFDIIYAMDVLEHIDDLEPYIKLFYKLPAPKGLIVVSGPTENFLYKIGRKIAGNRFTGDYHVTNISKIKKSFASCMEVTSIKKLLFPFVFFEIFIAKKTIKNV